ncbi:MAG: FeoA family protein [Bacteroidota bacterium]
MFRDKRNVRETNTLYHTGAGQHVRIVDIIGGRGMRQHLSQLGIGIGDVIFIKRNAPFGGPILIEHNGTEIAVGRGVAERIIVEETS